MYATVRVGFPFSFRENDRFVSFVFSSRDARDIDTTRVASQGRSRGPLVAAPGSRGEACAATSRRLRVCAARALVARGGPTASAAPRRRRDFTDGTMTGRSPLKQPGVPSKETAAEHARRIAKTRAAYASMSRRGGALHGALRPGSAASDRGAPRDPRQPCSSRETGDDSAAAPPGGRSALATGRSVDVLAALAYARGAERAKPRRFAVARESDDDDDDDDDDANLRPRRNLANISSPDDSSAPLTPSRAWFARSAFASRDV